jgi:hypothetical protein
LKAAVPNDGNAALWQRVTLFALLLSVFVAVALNCYFPDDYASLAMGEDLTALVLWVIPALQVLAAVVAAVAVRDWIVHSIGSLAYLWLFVVQDLVVLFSAGRKGKIGEEGDKLKTRVTTYLLRIDVPAAAAFTLLFALVARWVEDESQSEPFIAGVLSSQAIAALLGFAIVFFEQLGLVVSVTPNSPVAVLGSASPAAGFVDQAGAGPAMASPSLADTTSTYANPPVGSAGQAQQSNSGG